MHHGRDRKRQWTRAAGRFDALRSFVVYREAINEHVVYYKTTGPHSSGICPATSSHCVQLGSPPGFYANLAAGAGEDT